jgi:hypothetical protein
VSDDVGAEASQSEKVAVEMGRRRRREINEILITRE